MIYKDRERDIKRREIKIKKNKKLISMIKNFQI